MARRDGRLDLRGAVQTLSRIGDIRTANLTRASPQNPRLSTVGIPGWARSVTEAFRDRERAGAPDVREAVERTIELLDRGAIRVAEKVDGSWRVNSWVKEAILLYFGMRPLEPVEVGDLRFYDKIPAKTRLEEQGIRVVWLSLAALMVTAGVVWDSWTITTAPLSSSTRTGDRPRASAIFIAVHPAAGTSRRSGCDGSICGARRPVPTGDR
jgi:hypothetical protein